MDLTIEKLVKLVNVKEGTPVPFNLHKGIYLIREAFRNYEATHHPEVKGFQGFIEEIKSTPDFEL